MRVTFHHLFTAGLAVSAVSAIEINDQLIADSTTDLESRIDTIAAGEGDVTTQDLNALTQLRTELEAETSAEADALLEAVAAKKIPSLVGAKTAKGGKIGTKTKSVAKVAKGGKISKAKVGKGGAIGGSKKAKVPKGPNAKTADLDLKMKKELAKIKADKLKPTKGAKAKKQGKNLKPLPKIVKKTGAAGKNKTGKTTAAKKKAAALKQKGDAELKKINTMSAKAAADIKKKAAETKKIEDAANKKKAIDLQALKRSQAKLKEENALLKKKEAAAKLKRHNDALKKKAKDNKEKLAEAAAEALRNKEANEQTAKDGEDAARKQQTDAAAAAAKARAEEPTAEVQALQAKKRELEEQQKKEDAEVTDAQEKQNAENLRQELGLPENVMDEVNSKLQFITDIMKQDGLSGVSANMLKGLKKEMIEMAKTGASPVGAVDKRLQAHKQQAYLLAKKFDLIPDDTNKEAFMKDDNDFWSPPKAAASQAQTGSESLMDQFDDLPATC